MKIKPFKTQAELCWQAGRGWAVAKKSASNCSAEAGCLEGWRLSPIIKDIGEVGVPGPVCWQVQRSVTLLWADTVFISSCCLQQDQTVTHSYKLWWYMAPIIPHLDIKTLTCEQNKGWPCTSSCTVSIKMTDGGPQPRFPNITSKIFSFQFHSTKLKNSGIMDTRRSLRINIFDYPL